MGSPELTPSLIAEPDAIVNIGTRRRSTREAAKRARDAILITAQKEEENEVDAVDARSDSATVDERDCARDIRYDDDGSETCSINSDNMFNLVGGPSLIRGRRTTRADERAERRRQGFLKRLLERSHAVEAERTEGDGSVTALDAEILREERKLQRLRSDRKRAEETKRLRLETARTRRVTYDLPEIAEGDWFRYEDDACECFAVLIVGAETLDDDAVAVDVAMPLERFEWSGATKPDPKHTFEVEGVLYGFVIGANRFIFVRDEEDEDAWRLRRLVFDQRRDDDEGELARLHAVIRIGYADEESDASDDERSNESNESNESNLIN